MSYGERLAEERRRLGYQQEAFSRLVGTSQAKQSLYENDRRELRGEYLASVAECGVDVVYVLTGRRSETNLMSAGASALLSAYLTLPADMQAALVEFAKAMRNQFDRSATLHSPGPLYRADSEEAGEGAEDGGQTRHR
jgi:transcriptional regulator with XRE-family HTH domain